MKRRVFLIGTVALLLGGAAISVFTQKKKQEPVLQQIEYSNFTDMDTQTLLTDLLHEADVSDTRIQIFYEPCSAVQSGYEGGLAYCWI